MKDPRFVIDYGQYVHPGNEKNSAGSVVAFLATYGGLQDADNGRFVDSREYIDDDCTQVSFMLQSGIICRIRGNVDDPVLGWVPIFDFETPEKMAPDVKRELRAFVDWTERMYGIKKMLDDNQARFLKRFVLGEYKELP